MLAELLFSLGADDAVAKCCALRTAGYDPYVFWHRRLAFTCFRGESIISASRRFGASALCRVQPAEKKVSENQDDLQSFRVEPESSIRFRNTTPTALLLRVETTLESVVQSTLAPGGELTVSAGKSESSLNVYVQTAELSDPGLIEVLPD